MKSSFRHFKCVSPK